MLSKSFTNPKYPFFTEFDESVADEPTDKASYRDARTHLKMRSINNVYLTIERRGMKLDH